MITKITSKCRAVLQDVSKTDTETFEASGRTFTISQENTSVINSVTVNGTALASNKYSYDSINQIVTIVVGSVATGDVVIISYTYTKYSDTELLNYIKTALIYMSDYLYNPVFEVISGDDEIYPLPSLKEQNLISTIVGILINPDWTQYRTSTVQVVYDHSIKLSKEQKIEKLVARFKRSGEGITGILNITGESYGL